MNTRTATKIRNNAFSSLRYLFGRFVLYTLMAFILQVQAEPAVASGQIFKPTDTTKTLLSITDAIFTHMNPRSISHTKDGGAEFNIDINGEIYNLVATPEYGGIALRLSETGFKPDSMLMHAQLSDDSIIFYDEQWKQFAICSADEDCSYEIMTDAPPLSQPYVESLNNKTPEIEWFIVYALLGAIHDGLYGPIEGEAIYKNSTFKYADPASLSIDLQEALDKMSTAPPPDEFLDSTPEKNSMYFTAYSIGESDSGVAIGSGNLTVTFETLPVIRADNPVSLAFYYNSDTSNPRAIITTEIHRNDGADYTVDTETCEFIWEELNISSKVDMSTYCLPFIENFLVVKCPVAGGSTIFEYTFTGTGETLSIDGESLADFCDEDRIENAIQNSNTVATILSKSFRWLIRYPVDDPDIGHYVFSSTSGPEPDIIHYAPWNDSSDEDWFRQTYIIQNDPDDPFSWLKGSGSYGYELRYSKIVEGNYEVTYSIPESPCVTVGLENVHADSVSQIDVTGCDNTEIVETSGGTQQAEIVTESYTTLHDSYSSQYRRIAIRDERQSRFGAGWTLGGARRIVDRNEDDNLITVLDGNGSSSIFYRNPRYESVFMGPEGDFSFVQMVRLNTVPNLDDGTEEITDGYIQNLKDGTEVTYSSDGNIISVIDKSENRTSYSYDDQGRISGIHLPTGDSFSINYSWTTIPLEGHVIVKDPAGRKTHLRLGKCFAPGHNGQILLDTGVYAHLCSVEFEDPTGPITYVGTNYRRIASYEYDSKNRMVTKNGPLCEDPSNMEDSCATAIDNDDISHFYYSFSHDGKEIDLGFVERAEFPDGSTRVFQRGITDSDTSVSHQDVVNFWHEMDRGLSENENVSEFAPHVAGDMAHVIHYNAYSHDSSSSCYTTAGQDGYNPASSSCDDHRFTAYRVNQFGSITSHINELGEKTVITRNRDNMPEAITRPDGSRAFMEYDGNGNVLSEDIEGIGTTSYTYEYTYNQVTSVTDPNNSVTSYGYDMYGNLERKTLPTGEKTYYDYYYSDQPLNGLLKQESAGSNTMNPLVTTYNYDPNTANTSVVDPPGDLAPVLSAFDDFDNSGEGSGHGVGLVITSMVWSNRTTNSYYDYYTNLLKGTRDPEGNCTAYSYDTVGNRTHVFGPRAFSSCSIPQVEEFFLNPGGDNDKLSTRFDYDIAGRLTLSTKPEADGLRPSKEMTYDINGYMTSSTYYKRGVTSDDTYTPINYHYDKAGRLKEKQVVDGETTRYNYDMVGNVIGVEDFDLSINMTYDDGGRLRTARTADGSRSNSGGWRWYRPPALTLDYGYDPAGNRTSLSAVIGIDTNISASYGYDDSNRITDMNFYGGGAEGLGDASFKFDYDGFGRRSYLEGDALAQAPNGSWRTLQRHTEYSYNQSGLLMGIEHFDKKFNINCDPDGTDYEKELCGDTLQRLDYGEVYTDTDCLSEGVDSSCRGYDPAGRRRFTRNTFAGMDYSLAYGYDRNDRLTAAQHAMEDPLEKLGYPGTAEDFGYDASGNRTNSAAVYNMRNELTEDANWDYGYDLNGNNIWKQEKTGGKPNPRRVEYYYDADNRLEFVYGYEGTSRAYAAAYAYDPLGRRISKGVSLGAWADEEPWKFTFYGHDGDDVLVEYTTRTVYDPDIGVHETDSEPAISAVHLQGPGVDEHLAWWGRDVSQGGWWDQPFKGRLIFADGLGSTTLLFGVKDDNTTGIVGKYVYDSFGQLANICGADAWLYPFRYTGRAWDDFGSTGDTNQGLYYLRARYYDPVLGRFLQTDPVWATNLYAYAGNSVVNFKDPYGDDAILVNENRGHLALYIINPDGNFTISVYPTKADVMSLFKGSNAHTPQDTFRWDMLNEDYDYLYITGLDEESMRDWWNDVNEGTPKWSIARNCISWVEEALKMGGLDLEEWGFGYLSNLDPEIAFKNIQIAILLRFKYSMQTQTAPITGSKFEKVVGPEN